MKALTRFYQWLWHPSVRRQKLYNLGRGKASQYRYPSPGSVFQQKAPQDYRSPFQQTHYNVRYAQPTKVQRQPPILQTVAPGLSLSPIRKLVALKYLKQEDQNNQTAITEAKNKFKAKFGFDVEERQIYRNEMDLADQPGKTRQSIRQDIQKHMINVSTSAASQQLLCEEDQRRNQSPDVYILNSLDICELPHLQQAQLQNSYLLDREYKKRQNNGIITRQGSANFWKALDDSHDPKNIQKVQGKIGDPHPNDFSIKNSEVVFQFDKNGNVIDIHRKKQTDRIIK